MPRPAPGTGHSTEWPTRNRGSCNIRGQFRPTAGASTRRSRGITTSFLEETMPSNDSTRARPAPADLDARYGKIGISAVAAAVRYCSASDAPPTAPTEPEAADKQRTDIAA
jgi:hypothetical protein